MTMDRWGDSTHKMSAYNNRYQPTNRDQRQIDRMKREKMMLYPTLAPNPVLPKRIPGISGAPGVFPRGPGGLRGLNWRAEGLRVQPPMNGLEPEREEEPSTSGFYRQQREVAPFVSRRKFHRKSPSRRPHRRMPYPPSPSTEETQLQRMKLYKPQQQRESTQTPLRLPSPGMNLPAWTKKKVGKKKTVLGMPLPQKDYLKPPSNCTLPCPTSWTEPYRRLWINQAPPA